MVPTKLAMEQVVMDTDLDFETLLGIHRLLMEILSILASVK